MTDWSALCTLEWYRCLFLSCCLYACVSVSVGIRLCICLGLLPCLPVFLSAESLTKLWSILHFWGKASVSEGKQTVYELLHVSGVNAEPGFFFAYFKDVKLLLLKTLVLLKQETVSGSGISWAICMSAPHSRQISTPAPHHSVLYRPDALPAAQPTASKHRRLTWGSPRKRAVVKRVCVPCARNGLCHSASTRSWLVVVLR